MRSREGSFLSGGDTTLRYGLVGNLVTLVVVVAGVMGTVLLVGGYRAIAEVSERVIEQAGEYTEASLNSVFAPIEAQGEVIQDWGEAGDLVLHYDEIEALNKRLRPLVERNQHMSAVSFADSDGREYVAWQGGDTWVSRYSYGDHQDIEDSLWQRWDREGQEVEQWEEQRIDDSRTRPWYLGAMSASPGEAFWTDPFAFFFNDEPGMTMSRRYTDPDDGTARVIALGVSLRDISTFTTQIRPTEYGFASVLMDSGDIVGLPAESRYEEQAAIDEDVLAKAGSLGLETLADAWGRWDADNGEVHTVQGRSDELGRYRAGFRPYKLGDQSLVVATVVPRSDLTGVIDRQRNIAISASLLAILFAVLVGLRTSKKYRRRMAEVYDEAREFGQYTLGEKLGVGGMGEVYRAEHRMLKRPTAIKLLKPELYDNKSVKRFEREVKLSCRLTHPNTAQYGDHF